MRTTKWLGIALATGVSLAGCAMDEAATEPATETSANALGAAGMERMIPVRFSQLLSCMPGPGCPALNTDEDLQLAIDKANQVYRTAGIQFYLEANDLLNVPTLAAGIDAKDAAGDWQTYPFSAVKADLQKLVPNMPLDAWADGTQKGVRLWIHAANEVYEDVRHVHVWLAVTSRSSAGMPEHGRGIRMSNANMQHNHSTFAHEVGHFLGLVHPWDVDDTINPETGAVRTASDSWDLVYKPGTDSRHPHTFYNSRAEAAADEASLRLMHRHYNCVDDDPNKVAGTLTCQIGDPAGYVEYHETGDPAMKGLAFQYGDGERGANISSYDSADDAFPYSLADSQIAHIRQVLRWDFPLSASSATEYLDGFNTAVYGTPSLGSRRPRLGNVGPAEPAHHADFDGDGRRDIVYYVPPTAAGATGTFNVLLSSKGFSLLGGERMMVAFGGLGDVPVIADYNGDGRADVAVFQPGGGVNRDEPTNTTGLWRYCPTAASAVTTACVTPPAPIAFGTRSDAPIAGYDFDGVAGDELAIYRESNGTWSFRALGSSTVTTRSIGMARGGSMPLPGLYDCDEKADMAVYEPATARFRLLRSEQSWNTMTLHQFDASFVPHPDGSDADRSGSLALAGMTTMRRCGSLFPVYKPRRAAAVYFPEDSSWNVIWNPTAATAIQSCAAGSGGRDQPIPGLDADGNAQSDLAWYQPAATYGHPGIFWSQPTDAACAGAATGKQWSWAGRVRVRMWAVPDMTGDGANELLVLDPETMTLRWLTSESGYSTAVSRVIGSPNAALL